MNEDPFEILVVEDNDEDAELTLRALSKSGISSRILLVKDGAQALQVLFTQAEPGAAALAPRPKLVLLDLKLPKIDGIEVLRRIKSDERLRQIPVVMLTSSRQENDISTCYQLGANSYLVKPVELESFVKTVSQAGNYWMALNQVPD